MKIDRSVKESLTFDSAGNCDRARIIYVISEAASAADAVVLTNASAPETICGAKKTAISIVRSPGGGIFEVAVDYSLSRRRNITFTDKKSGDRQWRCNVAGRNTQLHEAYHTRSCSSSSAPDPGSMINWNGRSGAFSQSGSVDVISPELTEICVAVFRESAINSTFLKKIAAIAGKVNSTAFHGWAAGEVLFTGVTQGVPYENSAGTDLCDLTFNFSIRPNEIREINGSTVSVDGWDYVWNIPDPAEQGAVQATYVSQIYPRANFSALGIG